MREIEWLAGLFMCAGACVYLGVVIESGSLSVRLSIEPTILLSYNEDCLSFLVERLPVTTHNVADA